ncbi:MAG: hypothetical protein KJO15_11360 [Alphaproteobacteria bacterium]|nr:hypothetical protein [Alphaproteobacteria bacterium]
MARIIRLDGLAPAIKTAILRGTQPPEITLRRLLSTRLLIDLAEQEKRFSLIHQAIP